MAMRWPPSLAPHSRQTDVSHAPSDEPLSHSKDDGQPVTNGEPRPFYLEDSSQQQEEVQSTPGAGRDQTDNNERITALLARDEQRMTQLGGDTSLARDNGNVSPLLSENSADQPLAQNANRVSQPHNVNQALQLLNHDLSSQQGPLKEKPKESSPSRMNPRRGSRAQTRQIQKHKSKKPKRRAPSKAIASQSDQKLVSASCNQDYLFSSLADVQIRSTGELTFKVVWATTWASLKDLRGLLALQEARDLTEKRFGNDTWEKQCQMSNLSSFYY
ncbi:hypothetical protein EDB80DRAFT_873095 [Ilyonectria destructans]|nr:hypothetical protein EDB80DRAFT_873095 [Ilyonectria destructans]